MEGKRNNPWKGLDSYKETDHLYGRDEEIEILFSRIEYNVQTVVYSRSGIGKTSLINAGIFPKARNAGMMPVNIRLQHSSEKNVAGTPYIDQIKNAIADELSRIGGKAEELVPHKDGHPETLWEYLHRFRFYAYDEKGVRQVKPLIVFDQFEEIFTLEKNIKRIIEFFNQVADLLNGVMPEYLIEDEESRTGTLDQNKSGNIFKGIKGFTRNTGGIAYLQEDLFHIVFTLREDYLSFLERYTTHIPSLKMNRYCLLPITEEQAVSIIMNPRPGLVSIDVAQLIIEKITGETDFKLDGLPEIFVDSAILSLFLSCLYDRLPEGENQITAELVSKLSEDIIQDFYVEAIHDIPSSIVEYLEDNLLNNEGRRENVSVYNAKHIGGLTDEMLNSLSGEKRLIRRFAYGGDMRVEYIHDILCPVVLARRNTRHIVKLQQEERRKLLEQERNKRHLLMEKSKADKRRYHRWMTLGAMGFLLIALSWAYHQYMNNWTCSKYYASYAFIKGWPVGVGEELSEKKARHLAVSYKLTKKGHRSNIPFKSLETLSPDGDLLHNKKYTPLVSDSESKDKNARRFSNLLDNTKYMNFYSIENDETAYATKYEALDKDGHVLYVVTYFSSVDEQQNDLTSKVSYLWAIYTDAKGAPLQVRDNGADRMQVFLDNEGLEVKYMFFDGNRAPKQNHLGYYGYKLHYDELNRQDTLWVVDPFSEEQFKEILIYGENTEDYRCLDLQGNPIFHPSLGYHRRVIEKDDRGNIIKKFYYAPDGKYVNNDVRPAIVNLEYDEMNRVILTNDYDNEGKPYTQNAKYYCHREFQYIRNTIRKLYEKDYRWDTIQKRLVEVRRYEARLFGSVVEITTDDREKDIYRMVRMENDEQEQPVSVSYYGRNDKPIFDSISNFHKHIIERHKIPTGQTIVVHRYYDIDGTLFSHPEQRNYAIDSCVYDSQNLLLSQVRFDRDTVILLSQGYEYKDGVEVVRYAKGIQGTPIRCPKWERDGLCYYKLMSVRSSKDAFSFVKPVNEYGTTSWAYDGNDPMGLKERREQEISTYYLGSDWMKETITTVFADHIPYDAKMVMYVHLLHQNSIAEHLGLNDGDLLIETRNWKYASSPIQTATNDWGKLGENAQTIKVARYDIENQQWKVLSLYVPTFVGSFGCEVYPVYYNNKEYSEFKKVFEL